MLTYDLRAAARNLRRNRGFTASAIAILAIGIAASTGLFAVLDAVVLHPLPYAGADRLARVQLGYQQGEFVTAVLLGFGGVALLLASFGLFSVACYSIAHRTREFGIRIGLALSVAFGSILARWSIPSPNDPLVLSGVVATLLLSVLAATLIPARRAISVEPAVALRTD